MHTILVPVDGSLHALKALHIACDLAQKYDGRIALLHILATGKCAEDLLELASANSFPPKMNALLKKAASKTSSPAPQKILEMIGEKILDKAASKIERLDLQFDVLPMGIGDPVEIILAAQKRIGANTIVMGSRGVASSKQSSFGSVSNAVFQQATCTCLSVK